MGGGNLNRGLKPINEINNKAVAVIKCNLWEFK